MGVSCSKTTKPNKKKRFSISCKAEIQLKSSISEISESFFYNILIRKQGFSNENIEELDFYRNHELLLLENNMVSAIYSQYFQIINTQNLNSSLYKDFKVLYDFKTLIIAKSKEKPSFSDKNTNEFLAFLQEANVSIRKIHFLNIPIESFIEKYAFFKKNHKEIEKKPKFPAILFDFNDFLMEKNGKPRKSRLFIEILGFLDKNLDFYIKDLGISFVLTILLENPNKSPSNSLGKGVLSEICDIKSPDSIKKSRKLLKKVLEIGENVLFLYKLENYKELLDFLIEFLSNIIEKSC